MTTTGTPPRPKVGNITKFFVPGLAIGLAVGALGGAYYAPRLEQGMTAPATLNNAGPRPLPKSKSEPEESPESAPTGQTGSTGQPPNQPTPKPAVILGGSSNPK